ncbi:MAG: DUF2179 domain-containing protein [Acholeplasmataceae bacterium]
MADFIVEFFTASPWYIVLLVFTAKVVEVTLTTVRIIIVNRGFKLPGAVVSFIEVLIWVFVASRVVNNVAEAPLLGITYAFGYAVGVYVGSIVEKKLAFGKVLLHVIIPVESEEKVSHYIRSHKIGLTSIGAKGISSDKSVLMMYANRKNIEVLKEGILELEPHALIGESDVVTIDGGTVPKKSRIVK